MMDSLCILACSGPGAGRAIADAMRFGYISAGITFALLGATASLYLFVRRNPWAAILNLSPMVIHPAWTVSAIGGDCGTLKVFASHAWICLAVCMLIISTAITATRGRAAGDPADFQFSIKSLLLLTFAVAGLLALMRTQFADLVITVAGLGLVVIALKPIAFLRSVMDNRRLAQQALRERVQASRDRKGVPSDAFVGSRVSDRLRR